MHENEKLVLLDIRYSLKFAFKVRKSTGKVLCSVRHMLTVSVIAHKQNQIDICVHTKKGTVTWESGNIHSICHSQNVWLNCTWHHFQKVNSTAANMSANSLSITGHNKEMKLKLRLLWFFYLYSVSMCICFQFHNLPFSCKCCYKVMVWLGILSHSSICFSLIRFPFQKVLSIMSLVCVSVL